MIRLLLIVGGAIVVGLLLRRFTESDASAKEMRAVSQTDDGVRELLAQNRKVAAIRLYRQLHDVGLKEAKAAVERMAGQDS